MSKCKRCSAESKGSLCPECEILFKKALKEQTDIEYNFNIGDTVYILKSTRVNKSNSYKPIRVIFKGPSAWILKHWIYDGDSYLKNRFVLKPNSYHTVFECREIDKNSILSRRIENFYLTEEECIKANKKFLVDNEISVRKKMVYNLIDKRLDAILSDNIDNISDFNVDDFILPFMDEIDAKNQLYKQLREDIRQEILLNESDIIKNEIISKLYNDAVINFNKSIDKFMRNGINIILDKYSKEIMISLDNYIKDITNFN